MHLRFLWLLGERLTPNHIYVDALTANAKVHRKVHRFAAVMTNPSSMPTDDMPTRLPGLPGLVKLYSRAREVSMPFDKSTKSRIAALSVLARK